MATNIFFVTHFFIQPDYISKMEYFTPAPIPDHMPGLLVLIFFSSDIVFHKQIPGMTLPNGITSDNSGYLYVTGYLANKVYKIKL